MKMKKKLTAGHAKPVPCACAETNLFLFYFYIFLQNGYIVGRRRCRSRRRPEGVCNIVCTAQTALSHKHTHSEVIP